MNPDQQPGMKKEERKTDSNVLTKDGNDEGKGLARTGFGRAQDVQTTQCQALGEKKK
jgi:hypothetical protein